MSQSSTAFSVSRPIRFAVISLLILEFSACSPRIPSSANSTNDEVGASEQLENLPEISKTEYNVSAPQPTGRFTDLDPSETGIDLMHVWDPPQLHRSLNFGVFGSGVAIGDYDGDQLQDVFVARQTDAGRLYRNLGGMKFEDVTARVGIDPAGMWATGTTFVDINNDGRLDLFICGYHCPNRLYINDGGKFTEQAEKYGLDFDGSSVVMLFADYDRDGDLDGYLVTNHLKTTKPLGNLKVVRKPGQPPTVAPEQQERVYLQSHPSGRYRQARAGQFDHLYRNDGGKFVDANEEAGIGLEPYIGLSASWWDYNNDGWPDLYVANDFRGPDFLYRNNGPDASGKVTFTDVSKDAVPHTPWFSMGSDFADINNDGRLDYLATDMAGTSHYRDKLSMGEMSGADSMLWFLNWPTPPQYMRNALYLNSGTDRFLEVAFLTGLARSDWTWTAKFADFDNDGWEDVYFTNGMTRDIFNGDLRAQAKLVVQAYVKSGSRALRPGQVESAFWEKQEPYRLENLAFRNEGDLKFKNVGRDWGLDHLGVNTGGAVGDLDNDGDLDIVITGFEERTRVYRNDLANQNSIRIKLVGVKSNRNAAGARVTLQSESGQEQVRYVSPTRGFMSTSECIAHFGVGDATVIKKLTVDWPSGIQQVFSGLKTNATYSIVETKSAGKPVKTEPSTPMFAASDLLSHIRHEEQDFDDFQRQPLLPNKYSQLGPSMAWGDIDGDGDDDLYVGGASASAGMLIENMGNKRFVKKKQKQIEVDSKCEDMGALFFDADGDRDLDLYVVSGGVECEPGSDVLQDRLYLNDGAGNFSRSELLPNMKFSGGCVAASDYDRDGDLDLFVGGRIVAGAYPETPRSSLLQNNGDGFDDVTETDAGSLRLSGMVTSAIWSDVDGDDWPDLITTGEWEPVKFFKNDSGTLSEQTTEVGLNDRVGWFNSICGGDVDNDGDTDFVVGNFGLNTKYNASKENPAIIYYGDFEGKGRKRIVEAKFENGVCYPRRGLSCSSNAMPLVKEKLPTFHAFATADLAGIYTEEKLADAIRYEANELQSVVLVNESSSGQTKFAFKPLPRIAQASPVFGCVLTDVNLDGNLDLFVVQNFYGPQRETGYMDGGVSLLMLGNGTGDFAAVDPCDSGLVVVGDARSLTTTDLDDDGKVDFVVGRNSSNVVTFLNQTKTVSNVIRISKIAASRQTVGAKLFVKTKNGKTRLHEITAGSGYLSQSSNEVFGGVELQKAKWPTSVTTSAK